MRAFSSSVVSAVVVWFDTTVRLGAGSRKMRSSDHHFFPSFFRSRSGLRLLFVRECAYLEKTNLVVKNVYFTPLRLSARAPSCVLSAHVPLFRPLSLPMVTSTFCIAPPPRHVDQLSLTALQGLALRWEHRPHAVTADRARAYYAGATPGTFSFGVLVCILLRAAPTVPFRCCWILGCSCRSRSFASVGLPFFAPPCRRFLALGLSHRTGTFPKR